MKKKAINEIQFMKAKAAKKKYNFIAMQQQVEIKGESHLFVEVFENTRAGRKRPKLRIAFTKADWGLYYVEQDVWSAGSFRDEYGRNVWESSKGKRDSETYIAEADDEAIWSFCGEHAYTTKTYYNWTDRLSHLIDDIKYGRWVKRSEKRKAALEERKASTPDLPEDIEEWADNRLYMGMHYLYYKRHGRYADICCSSCGATAIRATKRTDSFEGQFEEVMETPRAGNTGICPICGKAGQWKPQGKTKGSWAMDRYCFVAQPYKEHGTVVRYVQVEKIFSLDETATDNRVEMSGARENYIITEIARRYLEKGKRPQTDFQKYDPYTGKNFWDDCNLDGMSNITVREGIIYEKSFKFLENTDFKYSAADIYRKSHIEFNLMDYLQRYMEYPQLEMFVKTGLTGIAEDMVRAHCGIIRNSDAKNPADFLGINRTRMKLLIEKDGDVSTLEAMQMERQLGANWTNKELNMVRETGIKAGDIELAMRYMSMQQLMNRIEKYTGVPMVEDSDMPLCGRASALIRATVSTYFDYLHMREQRGYDLHNTVFLYPRDLQDAHDKMVAELNKNKIEKRDLEVMEKYPNIKKAYRRLRNRYFYEDEDFVIRPARNALEIVQEGRTLHHCVGGDTYLSRHNEERDIILFLRIKGMEDTPYITVEIKGTTIMQWYGAYDKKPDKENMDRWLDGYVKHLMGQQYQTEEPMKATA